MCIAYPIEEKLMPALDGAVDRCVRAADRSASWPAGLGEELATLGVRSVNPADESKRPKFVEVVRTLRALTEKYPTPTMSPMGPSSVGSPGGYASFAPIPENSDTGSSGIHSTPYMLELVSADGVEVDRMPAHRRSLHLFPTLGEVAGRLTAPVGRQHQPDLFESWLPSNELRSCISRCAFEVSWSCQDAQIMATGNNPVALNGRILTRDKPMPLSVGAEVGFPYSQSGEIDLFLVLRFTLALPTAQTNAAAVAPTAVLDFAEDSAPVASALWALRCSFVEGLGEELPTLPAAVREFIVDDEPLVIGRQHQSKEFEALLSKAPMCMSFISRAHVQMEVQRGALLATNISTNPVYVDGEPLSKGESRRLQPYQVISFARLEGSTHVLFISFEAHPLDRSAAKTKAVK
ncbi:unnamed protein product [Effrenium voratum]|nr:unnamed protein product [Effrenium voratum]